MTRPSPAGVVVDQFLLGRSVEEPPEPLRGGPERAQLRVCEQDRHVLTDLAHRAGRVTAQRAPHGPLHTAPRSGQLPVSSPVTSRLDTNIRAGNWHQSRPEVLSSEAVGGRSFLTEHHSDRQAFIAAEATEGTVPVPQRRAFSTVHEKHVKKRGAAVLAMFNVAVVVGRRITGAVMARRRIYCSCTVQVRELPRIRPAARAAPRPTEATPTAVRSTLTHLQSAGSPVTEYGTGARYRPPARTERG